MVDGNLDVHEDFLGLCTTHSIDANTLVTIFHDVLLRLNLKLENCRRQCYDSASNMQGVRKGVAIQILKEEPKAIYTHCYGHALNLACQDIIMSINVIQKALDTTFELSKLLKYSSKHQASYQFQERNFTTSLDSIHYVQQDGLLEQICSLLFEPILKFYKQVIRVQKLVGLPPPALELLGRLP